MSSGQWRFKLSEIKRAGKAAKDIGYEVEVDAAQRVIRLVPPRQSESEPAATKEIVL
jgi:hypothetical protein